MRRTRAFTLIELLVVVAIIGVLAALILAAVSKPKSKARQTACANNLRQIDFGLRMYADDSADKTPRTPGTIQEPALNWTGYKNVMKGYLGLNGTSSARDNLFACPADAFYYDVASGGFAYLNQPVHEQTWSDFSSYGFNGGNARTNSNAPGIAGRSVSSIKNPSRTVLVAEISAFAPWSWHQPKKPLATANAIFNDAQNMVGFVDGHVSFIKIHWGGNDPPGSLALHHDPPAGYDYQWSGD
jgi:prepilin-type N-terminal cleavage/methylation domain-containing protein